MIRILHAGLGRPDEKTLRVYRVETVLNVSRVAEYDGCERKGYIKYNMGLAPNYTPKQGKERRDYALTGGQAFHLFENQLHTQGWGDDEVKRCIRDISATLDLIVEGSYTPTVRSNWEEKKRWFNEVATLYHQRWKNRQTYDRILATEAEGYAILKVGGRVICMMVTFDIIAEDDGVIVEIDTKTSTKDFTVIWMKQEWSLQRALYGSILDMAAPKVWDMPFGGSWLNYVSAEAPPKYPQPRTKDKTVVTEWLAKAREEWPNKYGEWTKGLFRRKLLNMDEDRRQEILENNEQLILRAADLSGVTTARYVRFTWPGPCNLGQQNECMWAKDCLIGELPDPDEWGRREKDYVDEVKELL